MRRGNVTSINNKKNISYFHLFDSFIDGVCIINELGYIEYINRAYENIFRVSAFSDEGKSIFATKNDDIMITSYREKKNIKGIIKHSIGANKIEGSTSLLFEDHEFKGIIAIYRKVEQKDKSILALPTTFKEYNYKLDKPFDKIIGNSNSIKKTLLRAQKASKTSSTIIITGESGTGKELVARVIHENSKRRDRPFVALNCAAIPSELLESELFGHEQGAFTGAIKEKIGKFEYANKGTLFLDEVGDLPMEMQVKLLRVLQEKEVERIGGNHTIKIDTRIIAATNKNLEKMIIDGKFREDLYYRLNVIPINVPPLRERKKDIPILIEYFLEKISKDMRMEDIIITDEAKRCLGDYYWPGNVRELQNIIERLIVLSEKNRIDYYDIPSNISKVYEVNNVDRETTSLINLNKRGALARLEEYEKEIIKVALQRFGSFNAAGKALGVTHKTVASKARKYHIIDENS
ncbi:sigma 54-interacting transcriptional regulator [Lutibacter sp. B2]|nr:sigma 54-interacting transcriptional regulator [Lutibacter sp. B2]